jgi:hypothetical protein
MTSNDHARGGARARPRGSRNLAALGFLLVAAGGIVFVPDGFAAVAAVAVVVAITALVALPTVRPGGETRAAGH